jgi:hypothetical protein
MTVIAYSGSATGNAIGLIACSRHQSSGYLPGSQHRPRMDFVNPVNGGPAVDYLRREMGYESSRSARTYWQFWNSEQWTGHTAVFVRLRGQAAWARGWVPQPSLLNYAGMLFGSEVPGHWQDDLAMIDDPTSISVEYDVSELTARSLIGYWESVRNQFTQYCFTVQGPGRCNCVWAATTVLRDYANFKGLTQIAAGLQKVQDCAQGKLMNQIAGGELLMT